RRTKPEGRVRSSCHDHPGRTMQGGRVAGEQSRTAGVGYRRCSRKQQELSGGNRSPHATGGKRETATVLLVPFGAGIVAGCGMVVNLDVADGEVLNRNVHIEAHTCVRVASSEGR